MATHPVIKRYFSHDQKGKAPNWPSFPRATQLTVTNLTNSPYKTTVQLSSLYDAIHVISIHIWMPQENTTQAQIDQTSHYNNMPWMVSVNTSNSCRLHICNWNYTLRASSCKQPQHNVHASHLTHITAQLHYIAFSTCMYVNMIFGPESPAPS